VLVVVVDGEDEGGYHAWQPADDGEDKYKEHHAAATGAYAACERRQEEAEEEINTAHFGLVSFLVSVTVRLKVHCTLRSTQKRDHGLRVDYQGV
jgi:hypothetical protein